MKEIIEISNIEQFNKEISDNTLTLVDFYATWCYPCKMQGPILEELKNQLLEKIKVLKIDVDSNEELCIKYAINSIPALYLFKNGELKDKVVGLSSKASLIEMIDKYL